MINIVIVIPKLEKRHLTVKRRTSAYSWTLRQIRGVVQTRAQRRFRSVYQL